MLNGTNVLSMVSESVLSFESETVVRATKQAMEAGISPLKIIEKGLAKGLNEVGARFQSGEFFLFELISAANAAKAGMELLKPLLQKSEGKTKLGTVIIGTVKGDLHDLGKNIVAAMLEASGFEVYDLGVDVPTETFIEKTKELHPEILGMSALLTPTMEEMGKVVEGLKEEGLRNKVKVIVGGSSMTEEFARKIGSDAWGADAADAVNKAKALLGK